jgi:uncharacterized protein YqkB
MQHGKGVSKAMNNFFDSQASSYGKSPRNNFHSEGHHCGVSGVVIVDLIAVRRGEYVLQLDKSRPSTVYTKHMKRRDSLKGHSIAEEQAIIDKAAMPMNVQEEVRARLQHIIRVD